MKKSLLSITFTTVFWGIAVFVVLTFFPNWLPWSSPDMNFQEISEAESQEYKSKYVTVKAGALLGSGCKTNSPGVYLTALHVIAPAIINDERITVEDEEVFVIAKSKLGEKEPDFALLSKDRKAEFKLPEYQFKLWENIVIVGSPGDQVAMVQPARITNVVVNSENGELRTSAKDVYMIYAKEGISGGCVYPQGSQNPVAVYTSLYDHNSPQPRLGTITMASKQVE